MSAQGAGATDASEESVATSEATEQSSNEQTLSPFEAEILKGAEADGHTIGLLPQPKAEEKTEETPEPEPEETETEEDDETPPDPSEEKGETPEEKPVAESEPEKKSIEEQIAAHKAKGEKPPWYLSRIAEESQKRRERTDDLRKAEDRLREADAELQQLRGQAAQSHTPAPTAQNPLADIYDERKLREVEESSEKILEFATKHPDGAEDVLVGKNSEGEVRKDFTKEEIADMRYRADKALRKDIPQRRAYLTARAQADATALEIYPEFKDAASDFPKEALGILKAKPELETVLGPEVLIWIGHALKGREAYLSRNGKSTTATSSATSTAAEKIERASKTKIAPTTTKSRALPERGKGADLAALNKRFEETGSAEDADRLLAAQLSPRRSGTVKKLEPTGE